MANMLHRKLYPITSYAFLFKNAIENFPGVISVKFVGYETPRHNDLIGKWFETSFDKASYIEVILDKEMFDFMPSAWSVLNDIEKNIGRWVCLNEA